jgi:hypothetical protein
LLFTGCRLPTIHFNAGNKQSHQLDKPIINTAWVRARLCKLQKGSTRLAAASEKVYQLLAQEKERRGGQ